MRIVLLCSAFNGLTQRTWAELRERGHTVVVLRAPEVDVAAAVAAARPDLVVYPFLRERVPAEVHRTYPTVVEHPGPEGDRGPSSLDRAIREGAGRRPAGRYVDLDRMDALREHQRAFLATALGGPAVYRGRSMSEAHAGLDVAPSTSTPWSGTSWPP